MNAVVVKVGGSLYDLPDLATSLKQYLAQLTYKRVLIVAGGGDCADAVRSLGATHGLSEELAHELALTSLEVTHRFLRFLCEVNTKPTLAWWTSDSRYHMLPTSMILQAYEQNYAPIPRSWSFTTDSLAACAAKLAGCPLILLKSTDPTCPAGTDIVDDYFPTIGVTDVKFVNFRAVALVNS